MVLVSLIGLTGGIASGKSTAAKMLADLGAEVIDADVLGHNAYAKGSVRIDTHTHTHTHTVKEIQKKKKKKKKHYSSRFYQC
jgi:dephospho-CoA kinase